MLGSEENPYKADLSDAPQPREWNISRAIGASIRFIVMMSFPIPIAIGSIYLFWGLKGILLNWMVFIPCAACVLYWSIMMPFAFNRLFPKN